LGARVPSGGTLLPPAIYLSPLATGVVLPRAGAFDCIGFKIALCPCSFVGLWHSEGVDGAETLLGEAERRVAAQFVLARPVREELLPGPASHGPLRSQVGAGPERAGCLAR